jgi:lipopolysaccharide export system protein LptA
LAVCAAFAAQAATGPAAAQIASSDEPIQITSTKDAVYSRSQGVFTFSENVRVVQGGSQLTSDSLTVFCARTEIPAAAESCDPISRIVAEGQVIYTTPNEKIRGDRAEYDYAADVITITGVVILSRGDEGVMRGTKVVYDVSRGTVAVTSDNEPVFGIFNSQRPDSQQAGARPPATDN